MVITITTKNIDEILKKFNKMKKNPHYQKSLIRQEWTIFYSSVYLLCRLSVAFSSRMYTAFTNSRLTHFGFPSVFKGSVRFCLLAQILKRFSLVHSIRFHVLKIDRLKVGVIARISYSVTTRLVNLDSTFCLRGLTNVLIFVRS